MSVVLKFAWTDLYNLFPSDIYDWDAWRRVSRKEDHVSSLVNSRDLHMYQRSLMRRLRLGTPISNQKSIEVGKHTYESMTAAAEADDAAQLVPVEYSPSSLSVKRRGAGGAIIRATEHLTLIYSPAPNLVVQRSDTHTAEATQNRAAKVYQRAPSFVSARTIINPLMT
jgi:hypothetical protein